MDSLGTECTSVTLHLKTFRGILALRTVAPASGKVLSLMEAIMYENQQPKEKAVLACVNTGAFDVQASLDELAELADTAGAEVLGQFIQNRDAPDNATYLGEGKLREIRDFCEEQKADLLILDDELSGSQIRNIEEITGVHAIDRTTLILDIFAGRARSREGRIQVELAQQKYRLPRLTGLGTQLSRQGGGIGTRGPGETKLESDRRHIAAALTLWKRSWLPWRRTGPVSGRGVPKMVRLR